MGLPNAGAGAPALSAAPRAPRPEGLSRRRKAAMVVQMLLRDGTDISLSKLPEEVQLDLTRELGQLKVIDRATVEAVANEFLNDLESVGLTAPGGLEGALATLRDRLSPAAAARLHRETPSGATDPWSLVAALKVEHLVPIMENECTEVAAVTLSKLPAGKAAELLGKLPGERARRVAFAVNQTSGISPAAVARIGRALAAEYGERPPTAFADMPEARLGTILNSSQPKTRDEVLEALDAEAPDFAKGVRKAIFTFANISDRVQPLDLPKVTRNVENDTLVTALAGAAQTGGDEGAAAEFILSSLPGRMAEALREGVAERGRVKKAEGEAAMADVVTAIRAAVEAGEISLIDVGDDEEDE
ncbi:flagellar motor switch protein FliG [Pseudoroseicyclus sp. CLL3-39]|uniref:Flagellar motor switch protein FliG n=2 Tax=Pseudoroseicyclus tamaricis TaxID=2705421 RepID=A0A6B2JI62_9RHOB|nr:flagellar motor switch protein FliG [Pseudoroseicyclus tamaricis]